MRALLSVATLALVSLAPLAAQDDVRPDREPPGRGIGALAEYLSLTDQQVEELIDIQNRLKAELKAIQQEINAKKHTIKEELDSDVPDANLIGQLMIEIKALNDKKKAVREEFQEPALAVLDDEQQRLLGPLEEALRLARPAAQALRFNLIGPVEDDDRFQGAAQRGRR